MNRQGDSMNREDPYRDQAERLRQRIVKVQVTNEPIAGLPPRGDLHQQRQKRKKAKFKLKYPLIRLLVLFFILLPIVSFSVYSYFDGLKSGGSVKTSSDPQGYETINFEKAEPKNEKKPETNQQAIPKEKPVSKAENVNASPMESQSQNTLPGSSPIISNSSDKNGAPPKNPSGSNQTKNPDGKKIVYHTVQPKETIFRIAINYYHSQSGVAIIKAANHMKTDAIETGQVLKIPLDQ